jgi:branched-chain amino acid transport system substrate-binding protein
VAASAACSSSGGSHSSQTSGGNGGSSGTTTSVGSIRVGFIAPTSGPAPYPTETLAIKGAVQYVNSALKGVNGHPLQVDVCQTDGTAEANVNCANGFVQNHDVAVLDGYDLADGAEQPILDRAGISDIGIVAGNETVDTSPNDFFLGPADEAFGSGPLQILHGQGVNSIAFAAPNLPADQTYANAALLPPAEKLGVNVSMSYFNPGNTQWAVIAQTLAAKHADMAGTIAASEAQCTSLLGALRAANVSGKIFLGGCSDFVKDAGVSKAQGVLSYTALWQPDMAAHAPKVIQDQLAVYKQAMTAVGGASITDQHGVAAFAVVMDADEVLSMIKGPITPSTVKQQFLSLKNWQPFLDPPATCDHKQWPGTATCTATLLVTQIASDGGTEPAVGSGFQPVSPVR